MGKPQIVFVADDLDYVYEDLLENFKPDDTNGYENQPIWLSKEATARDIY